jgi:hypothetical protein
MLLNASINGYNAGSPMNARAPAICSSHDELPNDSIIGAIALVSLMNAKETDATHRGDDSFVNS